MNTLFEVLHAMRFEVAFLCALLLLSWSRRPKEAVSKGKQHNLSTDDTDNVLKLSKSDIEGFIRGTTSSAKLRDANWLIPRLSEWLPQRRQQVWSVWNAYQKGLEVGLNPKVCSSELLDHFYIQLFQRLMQVGDTDKGVELLRQARERDVLQSGCRPAAIAIKICCSKQALMEALAIHDLFAAPAPTAHYDRSVLSSILFCDVEVRSYKRCDALWEQLRHANPSSKDYFHMVRYYASRNDSVVMMNLIREMKERTIDVEAVVYNTTFMTLVNLDQIDAARSLLVEHMDNFTDVISYNALMKGYLKARRFNECFTLFDKMRAHKLTPSQVTYGILLDCCICEHRTDRALEIFTTMNAEGCPPNTVICTTLIKGFIQDKKLKDAMLVYSRMMADERSAPDVITFSALIKAHCDIGNMDASFQLVDDMKSRGLSPDEVVFNNLIGGAAIRNDAELARQFFSDMISSGVAPSVATFSLMLRVLAACRLLDEAIELLQHEPERHNVEVAPRLYAQLMQACVRARQGRRALEAYALMVEKSVPSAALHTSVLGVCVKLNMFDTAVEFLEAIADHGDLSAHNIMMVKEAAEKKRKSEIVRQCNSLFSRVRS